MRSKKTLKQLQDEMEEIENIIKENEALLQSVKIQVDKLSKKKYDKFWH